MLLKKYSTFVSWAAMMSQYKFGLHCKTIYTGRNSAIPIVFWHGKLWLHVPGTAAGFFCNLTIGTEQWQFRCIHCLPFHTNITQEISSTLVFLINGSICLLRTVTRPLHLNQQTMETARVSSLPYRKLMTELADTQTDVQTYAPTDIHIANPYFAILQDQKYRKIISP